MTFYTLCLIPLPYTQLGPSPGANHHPIRRTVTFSPPVESPRNNLTRHGTGSAVHFKGLLMQKPYGTTLYHKGFQSAAVLFKGSLMQPPITSKFSNIYNVPLFLCVFGILFESKKTSKTRARKTLQILKKPFSTPPKVDAKITQNQTLDVPKSTFGGVRKKPVFGARNSPLLGNVLGRPGAVLGTPWARLGAVSGPSRGRLGNLGASWERLEAVLRCLGDVLARISLPRQLESNF